MGPISEKLRPAPHCPISPLTGQRRAGAPARGHPYLPRRTSATCRWEWAGRGHLGAVSGRSPPGVRRAPQRGGDSGVRLLPDLPRQRKGNDRGGAGRGLTQHLAEEQLLQVSQHGHHELGVHLEEGALLLALGGGRGPGALLRLGLAGEQLVVRLGVVAHGRLGSFAERLDLGVGAARDPAWLPQAGRERGQRGLGAARRAALGLEERVLGLGQRLGHQRSLAALGAALARALGRLGHVVAPLGLIQLHLLLRVRKEREVGERLLLAQVGGGRPAGDSAVHAAGLEDLELRRAGLGRAAAAGRLGALGQHGSAVRRRLPSRAPRLVRALAAAAAQLHLGLRALDAAAQHSAREERMDDPGVCRHRGRRGGRGRGGEGEGKDGRNRGGRERKGEGAEARGKKREAGGGEGKKPGSDGAGSGGRGGAGERQIKIFESIKEEHTPRSSPALGMPGADPGPLPARPVGPAGPELPASGSGGCGLRLGAQEGGGGRRRGGLCARAELGARIYFWLWRGWCLQPRSRGGGVWG
uniref:Uncharacterized protein n=1 Tax=Bos indicus x Bos taurus TaxID=30522 RepID=A0A4W2GAI3_BOBOX